eukprot:TRINITY_DN61352_c0_g1_i1.p2 TRINITY_DN61352_c0_g1~~TRINITY_DN61352_c0_g1_i1.p2  ORF type:complete len:435 (+),score=161.05 TRINITY_DN61352_c0_g1_i1:109-1305(+)
MSSTPRIGQVLWWNDEYHKGTISTYGFNKEPLVLLVDSTMFSGRALRPGANVDVFTNVKQDGTLAVQHVTGSGVVHHQLGPPKPDGEVMWWNEKEGSGVIKAQVQVQRFGGRPPFVGVTVHRDEIGEGNALYEGLPVTYKPVLIDENWCATAVTGPAVYSKLDKDQRLVARERMQRQAQRVGEARQDFYKAVVVSGVSEGDVDSVEIDGPSIGRPTLKAHDWHLYIINNPNCMFTAEHKGDRVVRLRVTAVHSTKRHGTLTHPYWVTVAEDLTLADAHQVWVQRKRDMYTKYLGKVAPPSPSQESLPPPDMSPPQRKPPRGSRGGTADLDVGTAARVTGAKRKVDERDDDLQNFNLLSNQVLLPIPPPPLQGSMPMQPQGFSMPVQPQGSMPMQQPME